MLCVGVVLIVLIFKNSGALAAAYGIAVTGVMVIDTFNVALVATKQWRWPLGNVILFFGALGIIDLLFLAANSLKIPEGGWLPLLIAAGMFLVIDRNHDGQINSQDLFDYLGCFLAPPATCF